MNRLQKALGIGALVLTLTTGCEEKKPEYVTGTVILERGTVAQLVESNGALFGNESVKIGPTYVIQIQTPKGLYTASIKEGQDRPLEALALAIQEGNHQVRIVKRCLDSPLRFGEDKVGYLNSDEILAGNNQ